MKEEFIDLGLPSGTLWATKNFTMGRQKHFAYSEAMLLEQMAESLELPSREDFEELIEHCTWKWIRLFGKIAGYKVTGPNGNSIFLPASGYYYGTTLNDSGTNGRYWSTAYYDSSYAGYLRFSSSSKYMDGNYRYYGLSVRAVRTHH